MHGAVAEWMRENMTMCCVFESPLVSPCFVVRGTRNRCRNGFGIGRGFAIGVEIALGIGRGLGFRIEFGIGIGFGIDSCVGIGVEIGRGFESLLSGFRNGWRGLVAAVWRILLLVQWQSAIE